MTLKELLGEQAKDIYFTATQRQMVGERLSIEEVQSFIRQSSIETVKWVMKMIEELPNVEIQTKKGNIESKVELKAVFRKDIKSELNMAMALREEMDNMNQSQENRLERKVEYWDDERGWVTWTSDVKIEETRMIQITEYMTIKELKKLYPLL